MGSSCTIHPCVRRDDGSIVESDLFKDLLHYTGNRNDAIGHYAVARDAQFINMAGDRAKFDKNNEMTFESYKDIVEMGDNPMLIDRLNEDVSSGEYSYNEAINRLQNFNKNSAYRKTYMATITPSGNGYFLHVTQRTPSQEAALENIIHKQSLQDRMIFYLNRLGVTADFLQDGSESSRYSTENAVKSSDGLYHLIKVSHGENIDDEMAEECGHFAVAALSDNNLVERLQNLLNEDVQKEILGDRYDTKNLGVNPRREVAGVLVGMALKDGIELKTPWQKLASRIANMAKKIFYKLNGNEVRLAMIQAKEISSQIARGFASPHFNGNIDNALAKKETLYSKNKTTNVEKYDEVLQRLKFMSESLKAISKDDFYKTIDNIRKMVGSMKDDTRNLGIIGSTVALQGIAEALYDIADLCGEDQEISKLLNSVDLDNLDNFFNKMAKYGRALRQVRDFLNGSIAIYKILETSLSNTSENKLEGPLDGIDLRGYGGLITVNMRSLLDNLATINQKISAQLAEKEFKFFSRFCQEYYGEKYVSHSARVIFKKEKDVLIPRAVRVGASKETSKEYFDRNLRTLENDISLYERYIASMSNNSDVIGQIMDKVVKEKGKIANDITNSIWDQLRILEKRFKDIEHVKLRDLFETLDDGSLSGNIISERNWGEWEKAREEFMKSETQKFKEANPDYTTYSEDYYALKWHEWMRPKMKEWNNENSEYNKEYKMYFPSINEDPNSHKKDYKNYKFDKLMSNNKKLREWYHDYMELKKSIDKMLPEGSNMPFRAPQVEGVFINKIKNKLAKKHSDNMKYDAATEKFRDTFCEDSKASDYGSMMTYNSEEETILFNAFEYEKEKINRIPLYAINKLKNMDKLSTNLFYSTLAYADMASNYKALDSIVDILEVGKNVLERRQVGGIKAENDADNEEKSLAYGRLLKFFEKQVYGMSAKKKNMFWLTLDNIVALSSRISAYLFLGGNVHGGIVNLGTGFIEIFKEAAAGEEINLKDLKNANKIYFESIINGKMNLLVRRWDSLGDNRQLYKEYKKNSIIYKALSKSIFLPYKLGEHYMQNIPYLALANSIKLWDKNNNELTLMDWYEKVDNEDALTGYKKGKTLKIKDDKIFFKSKDGKNTYDMISNIIRKIETSSLTSAEPLTEEEEKYLNENKLNLADRTNTVRRLKENMEGLTWTIKDESNFVDKAREICVRLHGIYNNYDKVALQNSIYGSALLVMKGYVLGYIQRRFAPQHESVILKHDSEGTIDTLFKVLMLNGVQEKEIGKTLAFILMPFSKKSRMMLRECGFSPTQCANLRRNFMDYLFIIILSILKHLLRKKDDEPEEESTSTGICYYLTNRWLREQSAFNTVEGMIKEVNGVRDLLPAGFNALFDIAKLAYEGVGAAVVKDRKNSNFYYQQSKSGKYEKYDSKFRVHLKSEAPYLRSKYPINRPYESSESYDYGAALKHR